MEAPEHSERAIREYVRIELKIPRDDPAAIDHVELVGRQAVGAEKFEIWDVHTRDEGRWWVITPFTNLYGQTDFKSADFTLTFHIGLRHRVFSRHEVPGTVDELGSLVACWRRWEQAAEALDFAEEAEEFQAVGMRLRETLVQFARTVADDALVGDAERPKASDFQGWGRLLAASLATGDRGRRLRGYLLDLVSGTWQYVSWLTHVTDAVRADAVIALEAVAHLLNTFGQLMFPSDSDGKQCPDCGSRKLVNDYRRDSVPMEWMLCEACGWEVPFAEEAPAPQDVGMPEAAAPPEGDCYTGTEGPGLLRRTSPTAK